MFYSCVFNVHGVSAQYSNAVQRTMDQPSHMSLRHFFGSSASASFLPVAGTPRMDLLRLVDPQIPLDKLIHIFLMKQQQAPKWRIMIK